MPPFFTPALPDPDPLPLPGPAIVFRLLLLLTFLLHLVPMNLVLGGSVIALATRLAPGRGAQTPAALRWFTSARPTLVAATVTLGVAPLLFLQVVYGRAFFGSAVLMAWLWLAIVPLVIVAYYASYRLAYAPARGELALALLATAGFLTVSALFSNNMSLMLRADRFVDLVGAGATGWALNTADPSLVPRHLHFLFGAIAVAGAGLAALGLTWQRLDTAGAVWAMRRGSAWFVAATIPSMVVGFWWVLALPREVLLRFMGRDPLAAVGLFVGIAAGMVAVAAHALAWRAANPAPAVRAGLLALGVTLVAMVLSRDQVRESSFALIGLAPASWVQTQWVPLAMFFVLLALSAVTIGWMARLLTRER